MNITEFARAAGQTKGAVSQVVKRLEAKGLVRRYKRGGNDKEVFVALTRSGREVYRRHRETNAETLEPLAAELQRYPDGTVDAFLSLFRWINAHLAQGRERMRGPG